MNVERLHSLQTVALPAGDERQIRLISGGIGVRWRGGMLLWQWPLAVEVERPGRLDRLAIPDVTRTMVLVLLLAAAALIGLAWLLQPTEQHEQAERNS